MDNVLWLFGKDTAGGGIENPCSPPWCNRKRLLNSILSSTVKLEDQEMFEIREVVHTATYTQTYPEFVVVALFMSNSVTPSFIVEIKRLKVPRCSENSGGWLAARTPSALYQPISQSANGGHHGYKRRDIGGNRSKRTPTSTGSSKSPSVCIHAQQCAQFFVGPTYAPRASIGAQMAQKACTRTVTGNIGSRCRLCRLCFLAYLFESSIFLEPSVKNTRLVLCMKGHTRLGVQLSALY